MKRNARGKELAPRIGHLILGLFIAMLCVAPQWAMAQTPDASWAMEPAKYGYAEKKDIPVPMDDGVVLLADAYSPTDPVSGAMARGRFPVLLIQTPYGKEHALHDYAETFVRRGYILAVADLRGFGKSQGQAAFFGARSGLDGAALVQWAAHLEQADGKVGLMGCSWLGVAQFFTANALPPRSPVKAMAPFCIDSNFYRDLTAFGGIPSQFALSVRVVTTPGVEDDVATDPFMHTILSEATGENSAYNEYWESLNVTKLMPKIVSSGIPVLTQSAWRDIFPGGNLDAVVASQNAFAGRPVDLPLKKGVAVSDRYQAIVGNWIHSEHTDGALEPIMLAWFDTWLKGKNTAFSQKGKPFHLYLLGENRWIDSATYPITDQATMFHLWPGTTFGSGSLRSDGAACGPQACSQRLMWAPEGPGATLTFDSEKLTSPLNIAGPGALTLYIRSTRPEVELTTTLFDVDPDGHATKITNGALLGSHRALNTAASWYSRNGTLIRPSHFFTTAKASPVPVGQTVRIDIELLPALIHISAGHRLRLVIATQPADDFRQYGPAMQLPNILTPTPEQLSNLAGGAYTISFGSDTPSALSLSTASDADLVSSRLDWGPGD